MTREKTKINAFTKKDLTLLRVLIKGLALEKRKAKRKKFPNESKHALGKKLRILNLCYGFLSGKKYSEIEANQPIREGSYLFWNTAFFMLAEIKAMSKDVILYLYNIRFEENEYREHLTEEKIKQWLLGKYSLERIEVINGEKK